MNTQYWLVELDQHGNPDLIDGSHDDRKGADEALYLRKRIGFFDKDKRYAIAKIELSEPDNEVHDINDEAADACRDMVDRYIKL